MLIKLVWTDANQLCKPVHSLRQEMLPAVVSSDKLLEANRKSTANSSF